MERDILRRTHNVFSTLKDESGNKYDEGDSSIMFVDDNTLKYQNMIKKMEKKSGSGSGGSGESGESEDSDDCKEQTVVITTSVKHVGKGVIQQSFDISDDDDDDRDDVDVRDNIKSTDIRPEIKVDTPASYNKKKVAYHQESEINVDDI